MSSNSQIKVYGGEIKMCIGGVYSMMERPQQVAVFIQRQKTMIFSHDRSIKIALEDAMQYIKSLIDDNDVKTQN